ncbi:uncharacterized protein FA14DRAFT_192784 [Meira miltonrushii]|uniref:Uncharacterized protein n=1 Tax=Meira miltonrushii TaxID=1280837 RepID=A0A316V2M5_9BASI|nr:uncharacterized protein FA14DRAFT_192784 [Meira miltonrushii]PWN31712.1 hypothetical protein FA14DRAFT_192784 [Meira miltonrushii]
MFRATLQTTNKNGIVSRSFYTAGRLSSSKFNFAPSRAFHRNTDLAALYPKGPCVAKARQQSTFVGEPSKQIDVKIESEIHKNELQLTDQQKEWRLPEEEAQTPEVIRPLLYFLGVGAVSFGFAGWLSVKDTRKAVENAKRQSEHLRDLHDKYPVGESADKDAYWGPINEADLRVIEKTNLIERRIARIEWLQYWANALHLPERFQKRTLKRYNDDKELYSDAEISVLPIIAFTAVVFIGIKLSRTGVLGKNAFNHLKKHILQIPAANKLHTLTTSTFSHVRLGSFLLNYFVILGLGSTFLQTPHFRKDLNGKPLHTAERSTKFHLLAFCICSGTFSSVFSQAFTRLMFIRVRSLFGTHAAKKIVGRTPEVGSAGISYSLAAMSFPDAFYARIDPIDGYEGQHKSRLEPLVSRIPKFQKTNTQDEWLKVESKTETPRVFRPFLFFVGIGAIGFTVAAWATVRETGDAVARAGKFTSLIPAVRESLPFKIEGDESAYWGSLNEQDIRKLSHLGMFLRQRKRKAFIKRWCDRLHISEKTRKKFTRFSNRLLTLSPLLKEEHRVTVPLIMFSTVAFVGVKACRGFLGQNMIALMRRHLSHIPVANRLHTLSTSNFIHVRTGSFLTNSVMISIIGGAYLTNRSFYTDDRGNSNHTAEATSFFHFLAFCFAVGTFGRLSSQVFSRILLMRAKQIANPKTLATVGRTPEMGSAGIVYGLLGMSIPHAIASGEWRDNKQLPFVALSIPSLALLLFSYNGVLIGLTVIGAEAALSINAAARMGSTLFGAAYFSFGNKYWERLKQVFYERDERLQKALLKKGNLVAAIQTLESPKLDEALSKKGKIMGALEKIEPSKVQEALSKKGKSIDVSQSTEPSKFEMLKQKIKDRKNKHTHDQ